MQNLPVRWAWGWVIPVNLPGQPEKRHSCINIQHTHSGSCDEVTLDPEHCALWLTMACRFDYPEANSTMHSQDCQHVP